LKKTRTKLTNKILTFSLYEPEEVCFLLRTVYAVVPPKVEYSLTERGKRCIPVISIMRNYGFELMKEFGVDVSGEDVKI
jgi:DNA-binding HxlR family transcriptional regulator